MPLLTNVCRCQCSLVSAVLRADLDQPNGQRPDQQSEWHPRFEDRAQQLVFIGQDMDEELMRGRLDDCLLDDSVAAGGSNAWETLTNPFPTPHQLEEERA